MSPAPKPTVLLDGLAYVETPRWHEGRLWFAHWGTGEIVAVDTDGDTEVVGHGPPKVNAAAPGHSLGWSIDWLPASTLIISESFAGRLTAFDIEANGSLSNRRVWAEGLGPDGICTDAEGAIWAQTADTPEGAIVRIREGGEVLERIEHDRAIFAAMLGGPDRTTLFLLAAEWRGVEQVQEAIAARTGQILTTKAPAPGAGWP